MKISPFFFLIFFWNQLSAQDNFFKIQKIYGGEDLSFPIVHGPNKLIEEKINVYLQLTELELLKSKSKRNPFGKVTVDPGTIYGGKTHMEYRILSNSNRNLAVKFTETSCGATCTYWVSYYNFNPKNGDRYSLSDFFEQKDFVIFRKQVASLRKGKIKKQLEKITNEAQPKLLLEYLLPAIEKDDLEDFYFSKDYIYFDIENLLHKNDKFWDIKTLSSIAIKEIKHLLNQQGKAVLITGENLKSLRSMNEPQLYEGTINKNLDFFLLFRNSYKNEFVGSYAYKKYGKAIYLKGKLEGKSFLFKEKDKDFKDFASINFTKNGNNLSGFWEDKTGKKLSFSAKRK